ncbi:MAG TPA: hypothetical protein VH061_09700 [Solirubrobacteraceae bacterium]|jgi:hypothetical protein|nr:hypothetical protein [Solirubrobacteraceae bacterium]
MDEEERQESRPPPHEAVEWHLSFVTEAYLPSQIAALKARLKDLGWDERRSWDRERDPVSPLRASGMSGGWRDLVTLLESGTVLDPLGDRRVEPLPEGVKSLRLWLGTVTQSLTVLIAVAEWSEEAGDALDRIANTDYETTYIPSGRGGHTVYGPAGRKGLEAERCRNAMHRRLSSWLSQRLSGAFTDLEAPLPFLDVVTTARARLFADDEVIWSHHDYRELLGLLPRDGVATSPSLPGWTLALPEREEPQTLILGARTVDVFTSKLLSMQGDEEARWAMLHYLDDRVKPTLLGWTTLRLVQAFETYFAATRDRELASHERLSRFTKRIARDELEVLRRGRDAAALCADIDARPSGEDLFLMRGLDFTISYPYDRPNVALREFWDWQIRERIGLVARLERDQRGQLVAVSELSGLAQNLGVQARILVLTIVLALLALATIALGVVQLTSGGDTKVVTVTTPAPSK